MNLKYLLGVLLVVPLAPIMYLQGKQVRAKVPVLPEAEGPQGESSFDSDRPALQLLTLGESTIAGVGVSTHNKGFTGSLARALATQLGRSVSWKVHAKSGYTAAEVHQKLVPEIVESKVDLIVIGIGANDAFTLNTPSGWKRSVRGLIEALRTACPTAQIVFCNMPPIKEFPAFPGLIRFFIGNLVEIFGTELAKLVTDYEAVHYLDRIITLEDWMHTAGPGATATDFFSDGVHPSPTAYTTWAIEVAKEIHQRGLISGQE